MSKIITCTERGIIIYYEKMNKSSFVPYENNNFISNFSSRSSTYQSEDIQFNLLQQIMYDKLVKGTGYYTKSELNNLPEHLIKLIKVKHSKAQFLVRKLRVDSYFKAETKLLNAIFPWVNLGSKMNDYYEGADVPNTVTNYSLGITKKVMVNTFIEHKLLPTDFLNISVTQIQNSL